jgi:molybdopterin adenylyltransferase
VKIQVSVMTVSDAAMAGTRSDVSGPAVVDRLEQLGYEVASISLVPDERPKIAAKLMALADSGTVAAIFTTGGTGITKRDVTPEATRDVIDREIPGIGEAMRADGRRNVPTAVLSRAIAGNRGTVLIVNLPGSPKGAVESLNAIVNLVPHMVDLLRGKTEHTS